MPRSSSLTKAKDEIFSTFSSAPQKTYFRAQLASVLVKNRTSWQLAKHTALPDFISFLKKYGKLKANKFRSENYAHEITRYSWGALSPLELALSVKPRAFLCHGTAAMLHGLTKPNRKTIYVNVEQSVKPSNDGLLTQDGINRAFSGKQRQSNLVYNCNGVSLVMIAGKNTNRLGVTEISSSTTEP